MFWKARTDTDSLNRRTWQLWGVTFALVFAFAAAVPLLYLPNAVPPGAEEGWRLENVYVSTVGLAGLVLVFCFYTVFKQRQLNRMRAALAREEQEKENVRTRLSELSTLFQVSATLNLPLRLEAILEIIVRRVVSTLRAQQASVMIYNPETGLLETRASYGLESEFARNAKKRLGEGIAGWVAERKEAVQLDSKQAAHGLHDHYKPNRNITSALSLPLRVGERCVGVLNVNRINHPENFQDFHRQMLQIFAEHVGAVIDRAETMERLGSRTRELEADNLRLSETNRLKDVFLSTASHELRTPLTSVIAYAELLVDGDADLDQTQRVEFLRRLRSEAGRLLALIEEILDLTKLESGKVSLKLAPVAVRDLVHAALETTRSAARKRDITLRETHEQDMPELNVDEVKMRQVVINLLVNAVKFSPPRAEVLVSTARDGDFVRIEVRDKGAGIHPDDAPHIFELFGQGTDQRQGPQSGLGIGLHLVKRITELHGGHVGVNSRPGQGSAFWVRLPFVVAAAEAESKAA